MEASEQRLEEEGEGGATREPQRQEEGHEGAGHLPLLWQHLPGIHRRGALRKMSARPGPSPVPSAPLTTGRMISSLGWPNLRAATVRPFPLDSSFLICQMGPLDMDISHAPGVQMPLPSFLAKCPPPGLPVPSMLLCPQGEQPRNSACGLNLGSPATENVGE